MRVRTRVRVSNDRNARERDLALLSFVVLARLFRDLAAFTPTLVGTYPLGLHVEGSDLDIACSGDLVALARAFGALGPVERHQDAIVAKVAWEIPIELYGSTLPVHRQAGFRHMTIESRLLSLGGDELRDRVRALKRTGVKTEPAFARVLGLDGDPYVALLELEPWSGDQLRSLVEGAASMRQSPQQA